MWRERFQTAVRFVGDGRIRKFFFKLLVDAGGFLGIALAQSLSKLKEHERTRHKNRRVLSQVAEYFGSLGVLSRAFVNHSRLILRHGDKFFVLAGADFLQFLEGLIVPLQVFVAKRCIVGSEPAGIRVWIFLG